MIEVTTIINTTSCDASDFEISYDEQGNEVWVLGEDCQITLGETVSKLAVMHLVMSWLQLKNQLPKTATVESFWDWVCIAAEEKFERDGKYTF